MNIAAPGSSVLHVATSAAELRRRGLDLATGQRLNGTVLTTSGDRALVDLNGTVVVARTEVGLREGQSFTVSVAESGSDLVLLRVMTDAGAAGQPARQAAGQPAGALAGRSLSTEDLSAALRQAGVGSSPETLLAARALLDQGLPVTARNVEYVVAQLSRHGGAAAETARALVAARALDLPPTREIVALLRQAMPEGGGAHLMDRIGDLRVALERLGAVITGPSPSESVEHAFEALAQALREAAGRIGGDAPGRVETMIAASTVPANEPARVADLVATLEAALRALPEAAGEPMADVGHRVLDLVSSAEGRLRAFIAAAEEALVTPASTPARGTAGLSGAGLVDAARQILTHLDSLSVLLASEAPSDQAINNTLTALRSLLDAHAPIPGQSPQAVVGELSLRLSALLNRLDAAVPWEPPPGFARARDLLGSVLERLAGGAQTRSGDDQIALLRAVIGRAQEALGELRGWEPPPVRALHRQLASTDAMLAEATGRGDARQAIGQALESLGDALRLSQDASQARRTDLLSLFVGRARSEVASLLLGHLQGTLDTVDGLTAQARAALGFPSGRGLIPGSEAVLADQLNALPGARAALSEAGLPPTALTHLLTSPAAAAQLRDALLELLPTLESLVPRHLEPLAASLSSAGPRGAELAAAMAAETSTATRPPSLDNLLALLLSARASLQASAQTDDALAASLNAGTQAARGHAARGMEVDLGGLARMLARLIARPAESAAATGEALRALSASLATSTEAKLLGPDPAGRTADDVRALLGRVGAGVERLSAVHGEADGADLAGRLAQVATATRAATGLVEAHQLVNAANVRLSTPIVAYMQVPIVVGDERRLAELKILRDPRRSSDDLDPDNMSVALRLETETLGLIVIMLQAHEGQLGLRFTVERPEFQRIIDRELPDLTRSLDQAGYQLAEVATEVRRNAGSRFDHAGTTSQDSGGLSLLA